MNGNGPGRPSASFIIPARNEEQYILRAVGSVLAQSAGDMRLECIVVDNGSTDGTVARLSSLAEVQSGKVRLVDEPRAGIGRAKNAGAAVAIADTFIFLDADSWAAPNLAIEVQRARSMGMQAGSIRVVADGGSRIDRMFFALMELGKVRFGVRAQMLFADAALFRELHGFDPDLRLGEDVDFLTRAAHALKDRGQPAPCHVTRSEIATSVRRLESAHHWGMATMFGRWALAYAGIGRRRPY